MADPLGIASSVVALVGLCLQTVQGVQKLLADVKDVPKDLEKLKVEIDELSRYLHLLTSTTSGLGNEDRQWGDNGAIETSIEHCDTTKRTLSASTEHLKSRNNRFEHYWKARKDAIIKCLLELQAQPYSVCVAVQGNNNWKKDADEVSFINARHQGIGWGSNLLRSVKRNRMLYPFLRLLGMEYLTADKRPLSPLEKCVLETQPGELPHKANLNAEANLGIARQVFERESPQTQKQTASNTMLQVGKRTRSQSICIATGTSLHRQYYMPSTRKSRWSGIPCAPKRTGRSR